jgi:hypothetical protein
MASLSTAYKSPEGSTGIGLHEIGSYFIRKYFEKGGNDPGFTATAKGFRTIS